MANLSRVRVLGLLSSPRLKWSAVLGNLGGQPLVGNLRGLNEAGI